MTVHPTPNRLHLPVLGTGFTIDAPLQLAHRGISSAISLVDDVLIEQVRRYHARRVGLTAQPVRATDDDARASRITRYLDLLGELSAAQDLVAEKWGELQVNIMTKVDRAFDASGLARPAALSDARAALRGFAQSQAGDAIVLSAGINRGLIEYAATLDSFFPDAEGRLRKAIILKVNDLRSAEIQGKLLARLGLWVTEFRLESGLNCGGHAFGGSGLMLGPILSQFAARRESLQGELHAVWTKALEARGFSAPPEAPEQRLTAQGGVGTADEHSFLHRHYGVDSVGWGTPFLLVPEVTHVDAETLQQLTHAEPQDIELSESSPLGVPFWTLRQSGSEQKRLARIAAGDPGSPCRKGYLASNTEFGPVPICVASREYQQQKLAQLEREVTDPVELAAARAGVLRKACICHDLGGSVAHEFGLDSRATPAVCPGPNIVNFGSIMQLDQLLDHVAGRVALQFRRERPHMFVRELQLAVEYWQQRDGVEALRQAAHPIRERLLEAVEYYEGLREAVGEAELDSFRLGLKQIRLALAES